MRLQLDHNPLTGESCYMQFDGDRMSIINTQDVTHIIEANKRLQNNPDLTRKGIKNDMWHYATVPNGVMLEWKQKFGVDFFDPNHRKEVFRLLNHPDYKYLKTTTLVHEIK